MNTLKDKRAVVTGAGQGLGEAIAHRLAGEGRLSTMGKYSPIPRSTSLSSVAQTLAKRSPFNAETDFEGVSIAVYVPFVITATMLRLMV